MARFSNIDGIRKSFVEVFKAEMQWAYLSGDTKALGGTIQDVTILEEDSVDGQGTRILIQRKANEEAYEIGNSAATGDALNFSIPAGRPFAELLFLKFLGNDEWEIQGKLIAPNMTTYQLDGAYYVRSFKLSVVGG